MKRTDPATDLAESAIRQWQMSGSKIARHDLAKETEVIPAEVRAGGGISTFTVGSVAGFLGAITRPSLHCLGACSATPFQKRDSATFPGARSASPPDRQP
jgi:hypothetical protein